MQQNILSHTGMITPKQSGLNPILLPKNESVLNILVCFLEQFQIFSRGLQTLVLQYKMFSTDFIFRQQENLVDNQKCQA